MNGDKPDTEARDSCALHKEIRSTNIEYRNNDQNSNDQIKKVFSILNFGNLNLFRISSLGFRIFSRRARVW